MLIDYHVHTGTSADATGDVNDVCRGAIKKGFSEICFTNHQEIGQANGGDYSYAMKNEKWPIHQAEVEKARLLFPGLKIKFGVELGYYEGYEKDILNFSKAFDFDFVIGSVHRFNGGYLGEDTYKNADNADEDAEKAIREYFRLLEKAIRLGYFDCVGHFDVIAKRFPKMDADCFVSEIDKCIAAMKDKGIGFELNTKGYAYANRDSYPCLKILKMLRNEGVEKVTIGSDSHTPNEQGFMIREGLVMLKKAGFDKICTFSGRKPIYHPI